MPSETSDREPKVHIFPESPEDLKAKFLKNLQDEINWCQNTADHWAEIKTFNLSKELVLFNLGILGFVGALREAYPVWIIILIFALSSSSILLSFWFLWTVINENINSVNRRRVKMQNVLDKFSSPQRSPLDFYAIIGDYNVEMASIFSESRAKEKCWNLVQKLSIYSFIISVAAAICGLLLELFTPKI